MSRTPLKRICVFCGSKLGDDPSYASATIAFADALVDAGFGLVYGGAHRGLMGVLADRVLERGGQVVGVIPQQLVDLEVAHHGLTELIVVPDMHARKATMAARADAFVALPGGFGTLEELMEVVTWALLGLHQKPCGVLNVEGYFDGLEAFVEHMIRAGFVRQDQRALLRFSYEPRALLEQLAIA